MADSMQAALAASYLSDSNAGYLEELYEQFLQNPDAVEPQWRQFFQSLPAVNGPEISHAQLRREFSLLNQRHPRGEFPPLKKGGRGGGSIVRAQASGG